MYGGNEQVLDLNASGVTEIVSPISLRFHVVSLILTNRRLVVTRYNVRLAKLAKDAGFIWRDWLATKTPDEILGLDERNYEISLSEVSGCKLKSVGEAWEYRLTLQTPNGKKVFKGVSQGFGRQVLDLVNG